MTDLREELARAFFGSNGAEFISPISTTADLRPADRDTVIYHQTEDISHQLKDFGDKSK